jgi:hypothetical protein
MGESNTAEFLAWSLTKRYSYPPFPDGQDANEMDADDSARGFEEVDDFAIKTLEALIARERALGIAHPTIENFVRMDIGCIYVASGREGTEVAGWRYFVNEVTRVPTMRLWGDTLDANKWAKIRKALLDGWLSSACRQVT